MTVPTTGETFAKLLEHIRKAEEEAAMMGHLTRANGSAKDNALADGWLAVSMLFNKIAVQVTTLAQGRLQ